MDYHNKKPYLSVFVYALAIVGFFVFVWNYNYIITQITSGVTHISNFITIDAPSQSDQLYDVLVDNIRLQNQTISQLEQQNRDMTYQLESASTSISTSTTKDPIAADAIKILLVAGHTAKTKGAVFKNTTEYELNYDLMIKLEKELVSRGYEVVTTHKDGDYNSNFLQYFDDNEQRILEFRENKKQQYNKEYPKGVVTNDTDHNYASPLGVVQLYGINLWANENAVDAVIHIHFNDYPGRPQDEIGEHSGFSIFTPLKTNNHFVESFMLAKYIEENMIRYINRSTVTNESAGVLESELIAVGQNNSVTIPAILIENGFVYENKFTNASQRNIVFTRQANSIANGIEEYFTTDK